MSIERRAARPAIGRLMIRVTAIRRTAFRGTVCLIPLLRTTATRAIFARTIFL